MKKILQKDFYLTVILMVSLISCEEDCDECPCVGCYGFNSNAIAIYSDMNTLLISPNNKLYSDSLIDTINYSRGNFSLRILFTDSVIKYEKIAQNIPFYLKLNSLHATPASQIFYFANDQIDSIKIFLETHSNDSLINSVFFNNHLINYYSNLSSFQYQQYFSSIDSILNLSDSFPNSEYGNFIFGINCTVDLDKVRNLGKFNFRVEAHINENDTLISRSQKVFAK
jgi:hypothetical protein